MYGGVGAIGDDRDVLTEPSSYIGDAGFGFEAAFRLKDYRFFVSGIVAHAFEGDDGVKTHFTIRSYH